MPIQRRPPGSDQNGNSSNEEKLTPLQRYIAKQKAEETQQAAGIEQGSEKKSFLSGIGSGLGAKASEMRSKVESKLTDAKTSIGGPGARPTAESADSESASFSRAPSPPSEPPLEKPSSAPSAEERVPGPFFVRFVAYLLDLVILGAAAKGIDRFFFGPLRWAGGPDIFGLEDSLYFVLYHALAFFYYGWFYSQKGASPGKIILQLEVKDAHSNAPLGYWRAFLRESIGKYISTVPFLLGFFLAGLRRDHRSLHDLIFDTQVLRKKSET